jgi:hypothetical protein
VDARRIGQHAVKIEDGRIEVAPVYLHRITNISSVARWPLRFTNLTQAVLRPHPRTTIVGQRASPNTSFTIAACGSSHLPLQARTIRSVDCFSDKRRTSAAGSPWVRDIRTCKWPRGQMHARRFRNSLLQAGHSCCG